MTTRRRRTAVALACAIATTSVACADAPDRRPPAAGRATTTTTTEAGAGAAGAAAPQPVPEAPTRIALRLDRRVADAATASFADVVRATLTDPRGWSAAGYEFVFADAAPYTVVLAEGDVVDALCRPYDVGGRFSCQNGPVVALNADRWRHATPQWTGDLHAYRQMLVNHEVGHLLGHHHPAVVCRTPGRPAPVMAQQSTELRGCLPNPWPLPWELACAARRLEPLAPGYEPDPEPLCGPEDVR